MSDTGPTAREIEQVLRAAGISKRFARRLIAGGYKSAAGTEAIDDPDAEAALAAKLRDMIRGISR